MFRTPRRNLTTLKKSVENVGLSSASEESGKEASRELERSDNVKGWKVKYDTTHLLAKRQETRAHEKELRHDVCWNLKQLRGGEVDCTKFVHLHAII